MYRIRTGRCVCCGLEQELTVDERHPFGSSACARCFVHVDMAPARHQDHASMYRQALADIEDDIALMQGERDFYRERSVSSAKSGETLIRVLTKIDDLHHDRSGRCSCGQPSCPVFEELVDPAVARLIGTYDEQQFTLYELRRANPGAGATEWDYVDVTLVYPPRSRRPAGRHRAAG